MKTIDIIDKYHDQKIVDKNQMFKIEVPAWYLKEIMKLINDKHWQELQKGGMYYDQALQQDKYRETAISKRWKWIYDFVRKQIKELDHEKQD